MTMPGKSDSYWSFLQRIFSEAQQLKDRGESRDKIEEFKLNGLKELREAILKMELSGELISQLEKAFHDNFGAPIGSVPVFLRSDTNMEDLKDFTGAGLNLTLFNIRSREEILEGIKRVWASPYTERSYMWRQKFLSNPENVFPSLLIIPSVDVDYSGVMITTGINEGNEDDLTVAFSRGAGGAVDGQAAETRLITSTSQKLLSPSRHPTYIRLPESGGTSKLYTSFERPILNQGNISDIRILAQEIRDCLDENQVYDVEFGFKNDKLWLFQIRPFVENKNARSSTYLQSIAPDIDMKQRIKWQDQIVM